MMVSQNNVGADIIRPFFYWMGLQSLHHRLRDATSLCTREAALRVTWQSLFRLLPSAKSTFPSGKAFPPGILFSGG